MVNFSLSYREVIPDQTLPDIWREITLNTGGTQSTLQDIKVAERANGYSYKEFSKHQTRNRFIYWRINHDCLEIVEHSLDVNLSGNKVRYRFIDTPILDGITIYETFVNIIILVPTVCSTYRLSFPHPDVLYRHDDTIASHPDLTIPSIFAESASNHGRDSTIFNVFTSPNSTNSQLPHVATSLLTHNEEALFLLGYPSGEVLLVRQSPTGQSISSELKYESFMPRFISGLAEKFRTKSNDGNVVVSMVLHTFDTETYALTLCRDGNLRIWSCSKEQCIAVIDVSSETSNTDRLLIQGGQNHLLRKAVGKSDSDVVLVIFMSFSTECQFHIFKPNITAGQFKITRVNTLYSPGKDLVDFNLTTNRVWSLWREDDGYTSVFTAALCVGGDEGTHWIPVTLESIPQVNFMLDTDFVDPKQDFLQHIFYPGRFPLHIISKALSIYKRSPILSEINVSPAALKQRICLAVENEIQNEFKEGEVSDEDYLDCANACWSRFYSCCVQYHVASLKPLGLLLLPVVSGVVLLKKSTFSLLRPHDALEHMMLSLDYTTIKQFLNHPLLSEDLQIAEDVIKLMSAIVYLELQLSDAFKYTFEKEMLQQKSPDVIMSGLITEMLTEMDEEFTWSISQQLNSCRDIYQAMHKLLELLRIESPRVQDLYQATEKSLISLNHLFSSTLGVSFVTQCLHQQAEVRFAVCRDLLVIQSILLDRGEHNWNLLEAVRSVCFPEIVVLTQATFATLYVTELTALPFLPLESTMQRLSSLKLSPVFNLKTTNMQTVSLLDMFVTSSGGIEAHKMFCSLPFDDETLAEWHTSLLPYTEILTQLVWPLSGSSVFPEWLLSSGQHIWLQRYVQLLNNWCEWNNCTRNFLLATSLLSTGEHNKAQDLFFKAAKGVFTDDFLKDRILSMPGSDQSESHAYVNYYLRVIQLFDLHGARECAINTAVTALSIADREDSHVATLYSIKFIHHLALGHYDDAYDAMNSNPDTERKKDNLRDLIKTLLDNKEMNKLMSFPYSDLEELFLNIIFTRARATDSIENVYYDFLYAFQMKRGTGFLRLAASIMYEQAFRLHKYNSVEALEKQIKCYLASINVLFLCDQRFAWIVRPANPEGEEKTIYLPTLAGSDEEAEVLRIKKQVDVLVMADIKKELEFASARLRLVRFDKEAVTNNLTTPSELAGLLSSVGIFKYALILCKSFGLSYDIVFQALAKQCILLSDSEDPNAWNWLIENDLHDLTIVGNSPSTVAWNLLQTYMNQYDEECLSIIHKAVCSKIITMGSYIPYWLVASYKKRNPSELLRLYYHNGRLEDAVTLAGEYILAALGYGKELFGFTHAMIPCGPQFGLPVNIIDALLYEIELQNKANATKPLEKEYEYLKDLFLKYLDTATRMSNETCRIEMANL